MADKKDIEDAVFRAESKLWQWVKSPISVKNFDDITEVTEDITIDECANAWVAGNPEKWKGQNIRVEVDDTLLAEMLQDCETFNIGTDHYGVLGMVQNISMRWSEGVEEDGTPYPATSGWVDRYQDKGRNFLMVSAEDTLGFIPSSPADKTAPLIRLLSANPKDFGGKFRIKDTPKIEGIQFAHAWVNNDKNQAKNYLPRTGVTKDERTKN